MTLRTLPLALVLAAASPAAEFKLTKLQEPTAHAAVADIDGDGRNDVVLHSRTLLSWRKYPGFEERRIRAGSFSGDRFAVADMDGDGDLDLVSGTTQPETKQFHVAWFENPGAKADGEWREHRVGDQGQYIKDLMAADFDRDGRPDIVARCHQYTVLYFRRNHGWTARKLSHPDHEGLDIGDLDGDGDLDLVLNGFWLEMPADPEKGDYTQHVIDRKWFEQKNGGWQDNNAQVRVADLNADGILDVLLSHSEKTGYPLSWYSVDALSQTRTGPWKEHRIAERFDWCQTLDVGDVDRDGRLDVLAAQFEREPNNRVTNEPPYPVVVFYNAAGDASKWRAQRLSETGLYAGVFGDVGSDGKLDIVGPHSYFKGPVELWENISRKAAIDRWRHITVDAARTRHDDKTAGGGGWFGLAAADLTSDGKKDIVAGKWFYRNPGGDMTGRWERVEFGRAADAVLAVDVDGDEFGDVIALRCNEQYWYEAADSQGSAWRERKIGSLPVCNHGTGAQGYALGQIVRGGKPEILLAATAIHYLQIPADPEAGPWPSVTIAGKANGEGIAPVDMDGDGDLDVVAAYQVVPGNKLDQRCDVVWWENPGDGSGDWKSRLVGRTAFRADRIAAADLNGDGRKDVVVTEERYPGRDPDASVSWFEHPARPGESWKRHTVATQYSTNNMDAADLDGDGDVDIVTCEHKGPRPKLQIWENDGRGVFREVRVDEGKESHLGARLADLDGDGLLDIFSIAWDNFQFLHVWRNDARR